MHKLKENLKPSYGAFSLQLGGETNDILATAVYVDMSKYNNVVAYAQGYDVASDAVLTLVLWEATSAAGAGSATTSKTTTATSTHATHKIVMQAEISAAELTTGYKYVGAKLKTSDTGGMEDVSILLLQANPRYGQATLP
jgi:phosphomannomutase